MNIFTSPSSQVQLVPFHFIILTITCSLSFLPLLLPPASSSSSFFVPPQVQLVVAMTNDMTMDSVGTILSVGANDFMRRPVTNEDILLRCVKKHTVRDPIIYVYTLYTPFIHLHSIYPYLCTPFIPLHYTCIYNHIYTEYASKRLFCKQPIK